jgi:hypothetical protein
MGNRINNPIAGHTYTIKCKVTNFGAFGSYAPQVHFYVDKPASYVGSGGHTLFGIGSAFTLLPAQSTVVTCLKKWRPVTSDDLMVGIVAEAFDFISDGLKYPFDATNDWHVGRHDFTSDFYVRDWTLSPTIHDLGNEPSTDGQFYVRSDVWNRRTNDPGPFVNDQPTNEEPHGGNDAIGDNYMFARISRNSARTKETVKAHFLFAEFGTGSPYVDCAPPAADPSVTFNVGETSKIISQKWHLHPSTSNHLCIAVQIYSDGDQYLAPGLTGYTPGWPTTDLMIINDNNKAQRNMTVFHGLEAKGMHFAMIYNGATFIRDFKLSVNASQETVKSFSNARIAVHGSDQAITLSEKATIEIPKMLPGERRWISFSYDSFSVREGGHLEVLFNETSGENILNGFGFQFKSASQKDILTSTINQQQSAFTRMHSVGVKSAKRGIALCNELVEKASLKNYIKALPELNSILAQSINELSESFNGLKDVFGVEENIGRLQEIGAREHSVDILTHHNILLNQLDAWITNALKSRGDEGSILFTVRLQKDVYTQKVFLTSCRYSQLIEKTSEFIDGHSSLKMANKNYQGFIREMMPFFKITVEQMCNRILETSFQQLVESLEGPVAGIQKTHLRFLNDIIRSVKKEL